MTLADAKRYIMYVEYLHHIRPLTDNIREMYNMYSNIYKKVVNLEKKISNEHHIEPTSNMTNIIYNMVNNSKPQKNRETSAKIIQKAYRKSKRTLENFTNRELQKLNNKVYGNYHLRTGNVGRARRLQDRSHHLLSDYGYARRNRLYENKKTEPAVKTIQRYFRGYKGRKITPRYNFMRDLYKDGRFEYYFNTLLKLEKVADRVLYRIAHGKFNHVSKSIQNVDPVTAITNIIGPCHYNPRPRVRLTNVTNVRKNLHLLKKKTPREYLMGLRKQFEYVSLAYSKMSQSNKKEYLDRLDVELSGRPCLENLLESLVKELSKQEFIWKGKYNEPLRQNNERYLGNKGLMNTAVQSWATSKNKIKPTGWNNMNLNTRKNVFWKMVKNLPLYMVNNGNIINGRPNKYNRNGLKFKKSKVSNYLEWV